MTKINSIAAYLFPVWLCLTVCFTNVVVGDQPNVIFVMPDDISHYSFSYYKTDGPRTPHIDAFATKSARLTDFHVSPTCSPTRAALMTGRFNAAAGVWHTIYQRNQLSADEITMAEVFKHNGYATGLFWKWHLGDNYPFHLPPDAREGVDAVTGSVENIDKNMGRLLKFLDEQGIADNTIVVFTTDNGGRGDNTPLRSGKGSEFDGGSRVPCFVRWPGGGIGGKGKGLDVDPLTAHIDWLPTFMDMLGFEDVPNRTEQLAIHGQSFKNFLDADPANDPGSEFKDRAVVIENMRTEKLEKYKKYSVKKDIWKDGKIVCRKGQRLFKLGSIIPRATRKVQSITTTLGQLSKKRSKSKVKTEANEFKLP